MDKNSEIFNDGDDDDDDDDDDNNNNNNNNNIQVNKNVQLEIFLFPDYLAQLLLPRKIFSILLTNLNAVCEVCNMQMNIDKSKY